MPAKERRIKPSYRKPKWSFREPKATSSPGYEVLLGTQTRYHQPPNITLRNNNCFAEGAGWEGHSSAALPGSSDLPAAKSCCSHSVSSVPCKTLTASKANKGNTKGKLTAGSKSQEDKPVPISQLFTSSH